ncbi:aquaporin [Selaginella moellendorffii]|uniref:aquaporin n=1 Tax=Selaginella moellendorffii TaxID=88036 RepID=UPI000D1C80F6|nr:aquaporin [Selaginella moellendorffii]|eukprot:XP_002971142.2 aquaporin [Selaginella moellendorffii]
MPLSYGGGERVMDVYDGIEPPESQHPHYHSRQASALQILSKFLQLQDFTSAEVWRSCLVECLATGAFVFASILIIVSCSQQSASPMTSISVLHFLVISFLILSVAPSSGGHLNPCITFMAMVLGYVSPSRVVMYTGAQCIGSIFGSLCMKLVLPHEVAHKFALGGCTIRNSAGAGFPVGSAFVAETFFTFFLMFIVATLALDPFRAPVFGAILAPTFIAAAVGVLVFVSGGLALGYSGAGMNPARCIGPAVVMGSHNEELWRGHWLWWVAPYFATVLVAVVYCLVPPHHVDIYRGRKDFISSLKKAFGSHHPQVPSETRISSENLTP